MVSPLERGIVQRRELVSQVLTAQDGSLPVCEAASRMVSEAPIRERQTDPKSSPRALADGRSSSQDRNAALCEFLFRGRRGH